MLNNPRALARVIEEHGGTILTPKPITRFAVEGGRATAVETEDGSAYAADRAIVSMLLCLSSGYFGRRHALQDVVDLARNVAL